MCACVCVCVCVRAVECILPYQIEPGSSEYFSDALTTKPPELLGVGAENITTGV